MILYRALRAAARIALEWYYADLVVEGRAHLPANGPMLLVANHPNALVDAMAVAVAVRRRVLLTAKATLFEQPALAALLRAVGVVPLRRAKDEQGASAGSALSAARNADAFAAVTTALARGGAVLVFPEGISHDAPTLAPLRTGAARMALRAHAAGVRALRVVSIGMTYEEKERPRSRLLVRIGEPLELDAWLAAHGSDAAALTAELDTRLRRVTLNFTSDVRARRALNLARTLDAVASEVESLAHPRSLTHAADLARRIDAACDALTTAPEPVLRQVDAFVAAMEAFEQRLAAHGIALSELRVSPRLRHGAWFVLRECLLLALALPAALVDRVAHDIPLRLARTLARRSLAADPSRDQPAMRTILLAAALLVAWYLVLGGLLARWLGVGVALLVLAIMLLSASAEFALRDRLSRARQRARTYLALRADPTLRSSTLAAADHLLGEARTLERTLLAARLDAPAVR